MTSKMHPLTFSALLVIGLGGCSQPAPPELPDVPVTVAKPLTEQVWQYVQINGRSEASAIFEARARVEGTLEPLDSEFQEGTLVKQGQLLFVIEQEPYEAKLDSALFLLFAALSQEEAAHAQKTTAEAHLKAAEAAEKLADAELKRTETLFKQNVATQSELDLRKAQKEVASAEIDTAKAALSDAEAAISVAESAIDRETANFERAEIEFGYTTIRSEVDGLMGEVLVDPGNIVGRGDNTLLATVRQIDPLHIYFDAPERVVLGHLREVYEGSRKDHQEVILEVQFEGEEGFPHRGHLELLDNRVDPSTGTALLRGIIENPYSGKDAEQEVPFQQRKYLLRPGAYARIRIKTDAIPDAPLVHESAIGTDLSGKYLLIVNEENQVEQRRIRLGQRYHEFRHITALWKPDEAEPETSTEPVSTDFRYILDGLLRARPGVKVNVTDEVELTYPEDETRFTVEEIDTTVVPAETRDQNSNAPSSSSRPEGSESEESTNPESPGANPPDKPESCSNP